jgi:Tol biopolymer transport system component
VFQKLTGIKGAFRTRIAYVVQSNGGQFPYELRVSDYDGYNRRRSPLFAAADVSGVVTGCL